MLNRHWVPSPIAYIAIYVWITVQYVSDKAAVFRLLRFDWETIRIDKLRLKIYNTHEIIKHEIYISSSCFALFSNTLIVKQE